MFQPSKSQANQLFQKTSVHTPTEHTQMSSGLKTRSDDFQIPKSNKRKENAYINKYLKEKKEDRDHFKKCLEELTTPEPEEDATDMFFKTVAATVKKFRPDLATKTKAKIFQITTEMELLNQQSLNIGFTNIIHGDSEIIPLICSIIYMHYPIYFYPCGH